MYVPRKEPFPIPLRFIDSPRSNKDDFGVMLAGRMEAGSVHDPFAKEGPERSLPFANQAPFFRSSPKKPSSPSPSNPGGRGGTKGRGEERFEGEEVLSPLQPSTSSSFPRGVSGVLGRVLAPERGGVPKAKLRSWGRNGASKCGG